MGIQAFVTLRSCLVIKYIQLHLRFDVGKKKNPKCLKWSRAEKAERSLLFSYILFILSHKRDNGCVIGASVAHSCGLFQTGAVKTPADFDPSGTRTV